MTNSMIPPAVRAFTLLLRLMLPRHVHDRFGHEMLEVFRDLHRAGQREYRLTGGMRALFAELPGLFRLAWRERFVHDAFDSHTPTHFNTERGMLQGTGTDLRYIMRTLRRSKGFATIAVLSLGLGIGANTATYSVIRELLLAPLPVQSPEELRLVTWRRDAEVPGINQSNSSQYEDPAGGAMYASNLSWQLYQSLRNAAPEGVRLSSFAFLRGATLRIGSNPAILASGILADGHFFATVQPEMAIGRALTAADDEPGAPLTVVLSHNLWQSAFAGDTAVLSTVIRLNGEIARIVGVTGAGYRGMSIGGFFPQTDITVPLSAQPRLFAQLSRDRSAFASDNLFWLRTIARVPPPLSLAPVESQLTAALRRTPSPLNEGEGSPAIIRLLDGSRGAEPLRGESVTLLYLLGAVTAFILLIACTNLSSLMLARGVSRQREIAVRLALGGGRGRILRALLMESLVLGIGGTLVGLALTVVTRGAFARMLEGVVGSAAFGATNVSVLLDPTMLGVGVAIGIIAGILATLLPAFRLLRLDPASRLTQRSNAAGNPRLRQGRALIALQIAITLPLVIGSALFLRTLSNLGRVPLGFDPQGVAVFRVNPAYAGVGESHHDQLYAEVLRRLKNIPGVVSASLMENALMSGIVSNTSVMVNGSQRSLYMNAVGPDFAPTLGVRVMEGRLPGAADTIGAARVAAVNETAVAKLFDGRSPLGQTLRVHGSDVIIVGVVADTRYQSRRDSVPPTMYDAAFQRAGWGGHHVVLRTSVPLATLERAIREAVASVHPDMPVPSLRSQLEIIEQSRSRELLFARALTFSGVLALALACIGLYGITAYSVARRTNEIGVRVAVGAMPQQVLWLVLRQVVLLAVTGIAVGLPLALGGTRFIRSMLYGVAPNDVVTILAATTTLLGVAAVAGLLPALRASRMDAMAALRTE